MGKVKQLLLRAIGRGGYTLLKNDDYRRSQTSHEELARNFQRLQTEYYQVVHDHKELQVEHRQRTKDYLALRAEHQQLSQDYRVLRAEHHQRVHDYQALQGERHQLAGRLHELESQLEDSSQLQAEHQQLIGRAHELESQLEPYQRLQLEHQRVAGRMHELEAQLQAQLTGYQHLQAESERRLQELEAQFRVTRENFERMTSAYVDQRTGHEHAIRELERSRAEHWQLHERLALALDENRRLNIRVTEAPEIDYQVLMRQQHEEAQFRDADPAFMSLYERVKPYSMTSTERLYAMHKAVEYVSKARIPGSIVESGVWRGGSVMMAALTLIALSDTDRKLVLYDTFEGLPKPDPTEDIDLWGHSSYNEWTRHRKTDNSSDWANASLEEVRENIASTGYPMENVVFVKGMVQETLPHNLPDAISLLRLDTDWHESTVSELANLYPLLSKNGVLIVDDYGHLKGQRKAVDEYFAAHNESVLLNRIDYSGRVAIKMTSSKREDRKITRRESASS